MATGTARRYLRTDATTEDAARAAIQTKIEDHLAEFGYDDLSGQWNTKANSRIDFYHDNLFTTGEEAVGWVRDHCDLDEAIRLVRVRRVIAKTKTQQNKLDSIKGKIAKVTDDLMAIANQTGRNGPELWCSIADLSEGSTVQRDRRSEIHTQAMNRVKSAKSNFRGCGVCQSRINLERLDRAACPVCGNRSFLLSTTDEERLARLDAKQNDKIEALRGLNTELAELSRPIISESEDDWHWLAVADCPN